MMNKLAYRALRASSSPFCLLNYRSIVRLSLLLCFFLLLEHSAYAQTDDKTPIAYDVRTANITTMGRQKISDLNAVAINGAITNYTIISLPSAGTLHIGMSGRTLSAGSTLNTVEAKDLYYTPSTMWLVIDWSLDPTGVFNFKYSATDGNGSTSNAATYEIPVESPLPPNRPPSAADVTTAPVPNTAPAPSPATAIQPFSATDSDGSIANYRITTLPDPSQGVLYVNGVAATAGQIVKPEQAKALSFRPAASYTGFVTFKYTATDNMGLSDSSPATYTIEVVPDADADGVLNANDLDNDNDGIPDTMEGSGDKDGDGIANIFDLDADGDGILDAVEANNGKVPSADIFDLQTGRYTSPVGVNGLVDALETTNPDSGTINYTLADTDGDGLMDFLDIDSDNDGIRDNQEAQPLNTRVIASGQDMDKDGIDDAFDSSCGCDKQGTVLIPLNSDSDPIPDYLDTDSDNDGTPDEHEAHDVNINGQSADDLLILAGNNALYPTADASTTWLKDSDGNRVTDYLQFGTAYYYDANNNGLVDLFDITDKRHENNINSSFRNGSVVTPLPVTLISFTARTQQNDVLLQWATASEQDSKYFSVERSVNGKKFQAIGTVKAKGYSNILQGYTFTDRAPAEGINYYRLRQVDLDGTFTLSAVAAARAPGSAVRSSLTAYPNPTAADMTLVVEGVQAETVSVKVLDLLGNTLMKKAVALEPGSNAVALSLSNLSSGIYLVMVEGEEFRFTKRVMKK